MLASYLSSLALFFLFALPTHAAVSWIAKIRPQDEECFALRLPRASATANALQDNTFLRLSYELLNDDEDEGVADPLYVFVMDGSDNSLYAARGRWRDRVQVPVQAGERYWLCLQNESEDEEEHDNLRRVVGFSYDIYRPHVEQQQQQNEQILKQHYEHLSLADAVQGTLKDLLHHHDYRRAKEGQQRATTEETFTKLLKWGLTQAAVVVCVACLQVGYIRRLLERKRSFLM